MLPTLGFVVLWTSPKKTDNMLAMSEPNPTLVWETITAHQRSAALKAGVELGVFDALSKGPITAAELARNAGVAERPMRILCDFLAVHGLINKADGHFCHTPTSAAFLDSHSPASMAPTLPFLMNDKLIKATHLLTETIRQNRTALDEPLAGDETREWVTFARTMQPMMRTAAEFIAGVILRAGMPAKVLDVAASHGLFGITVARLAPQCEIVALDFPSVLEVTAENARAAGVRITLLPGSAFSAELGTDYDAVIVTNLFHHFDRTDNITLMKRFHAALRPGGLMVILEFVPNEDRISPPVPASFSLMMLANTPGGDAYTMAEYCQMLDAAGFGTREIIDVPGSAQQLIVASA
ncbi:MAG: class I SAM-dependent methyltransferase [Acidobacteriaceae bacterium]|nr:class I SAM-dependent methyltransferase [Acidobacteriaceae bacterium]